MDALRFCDKKEFLQNAEAISDIANQLLDLLNSIYKAFYSSDTFESISLQKYIKQVNEGFIKINSHGLNVESIPTNTYLPDEYEVKESAVARWVNDMFSYVKDIISLCEKWSALIDAETRTFDDYNLFPCMDSTDQLPAQPFALSSFVNAINEYFEFTHRREEALAKTFLRVAGFDAEFDISSHDFSDYPKMLIPPSVKDCLIICIWFKRRINEARTLSAEEINALRDKFYCPVGKFRNQNVSELSIEDTKDFLEMCLYVMSKLIKCYCFEAFNCCLITDISEIESGLIMAPTYFVEEYYERLKWAESHDKRCMYYPEKAKAFLTDIYLTSYDCEHILNHCQTLIDEMSYEADKQLLRDRARLESKELPKAAQMRIMDDTEKTVKALKRPSKFNYLITEMHQKTAYGYGIELFGEDLCSYKDNYLCKRLTDIEEAIKIADDKKMALLSDRLHREYARYSAVLHRLINEHDEFKRRS